MLLVIATLTSAKSALAQEEVAAQETLQITIPNPLSVEIVEDEQSSELEQRSLDLSEQDLTAQENMAAATAEMNAATQSMRIDSRISVWLVGVGTIALIFTLYLTAVATRAATASVVITKRMGQHQSKAYCVVREATLEHNPDWNPSDPDHEMYCVRLVVENVGLTPALDVIISSEVTFGTEFDVKNYSDPMAWDNRYVLGTNQTASSLLGVSEGISDRKGHRTYWVHGSIRYTDIYDEVWETLFLLKLENYSPASTFEEMYFGQHHFGNTFIRPQED